RAGERLRHAAPDGNTRQPAEGLQWRDDKTIFSPASTARSTGVADFRRSPARQRNLLNVVVCKEGHGRSVRRKKWKRSPFGSGKRGFCVLPPPPHHQLALRDEYDYRSIR